MLKDNLSRQKRASGHENDLAGLLLSLFWGQRRYKFNGKTLSHSIPCHLSPAMSSLRWVETRVLKTLACRNGFWTSFEALLDSVSARFKNARVEKMPLNIRIQWNAGTACVLECVLKTLACRGLRVGPSKCLPWFFWLPWLILSHDFPLLFWCLSCLVQGFPRSSELLSDDCSYKLWPSWSSSYRIVWWVVPPKSYAWHSQSETAVTSFYDRVKFWAKNWAKFWTHFSGHFRASWAVQNDPPNYLPKFLPIDHADSRRVSWQLLWLKSQNSSPRASGAWGAQKVAERQDLTILFFSQDFWILRSSQCANKECRGLELHRTGSNVSDNAGGLRRHLAGSAVPLLWLQSPANTQRLGAVEKLRQPVRHFL